MTWDPDFEELMDETVLLETVLTRDARSRPLTFAGPVAYPAHIERAEDVITDEAGPVWQRAATIFLGGAPDVTQDDRLTLPDGSQPPIERVTRQRDEDGGHHTAVTIRYRR